MSTRLSKEFTSGIARILAAGDDETQAEFFNAFANEVYVICRGNDDNQTVHIAKHLDSFGKKLIQDLAEFVRLREAKEPA